jgi:hypothetical protein
MGMDKKWLVANMAAAAIFLPWLPTFVSQASRVNSGFWIEKVGTHSLLDTLAQIVMYDSFPGGQGPARKVFGVILLAALVVAGYWLWRQLARQEKAALILLAGPLTVSMVVLFLYSIPPFTSSIYFARYFAAFAVLFYASFAYIAWLLLRYSSKRMTIFFTVSIVALMIAGTTQVIWGWGRDHFKANEAMAQLNSVLVSGDAVVANDYWHTYDVIHYIDEDFTPQTKVEGNFYGGEVLLIGREDILLDRFEDVKTRTGTIWFISGDDETQLDVVPTNWNKKETFYYQNDFRITRYTTY